MVTRIHVDNPENRQRSLFASFQAVPQVITYPQFYVVEANESAAAHDEFNRECTKRMANAPLPPSVHPGPPVSSSTWTHAQPTHPLTRANTDTDALTQVVESGGFKRKGFLCSMRDLHSQELRYWNIGAQRRRSNDPICDVATKLAVHEAPYAPG